MYSALVVVYTAYTALYKLSDLHYITLQTSCVAVAGATDTVCPRPRAIQLHNHMFIAGHGS